MAGSARRAATESLNRNCSAEKIVGCAGSIQGAVSAVGDLVAWATHDVRGLLGAVECQCWSFAEDDFWVPSRWSRNR
jgi:hypothetical protein